MEIKTKFKQGDKVYCIEYKSSKCDDCVREENEIFKSYRVKEGIIKLVENVAIITTDNRYIYKQDCFATKEEAQKECDKRNGNK